MRNLKERDRLHEKQLRKTRERAKDKSMGRKRRDREETDGDVRETERNDDEGANRTGSFSTPLITHLRLAFISSLLPSLPSFPPFFPASVSGRSLAVASALSSRV